jgi:oxygen-independent coproporphyrinogen-3 oxidase
MMNMLRLNEGIHPSMFMQRTGLPISDVQSQLETAEAKKLIEWNIQALKPTTKGQRYLNELLQIFMQETSEV